MIHLFFIALTLVFLFLTLLFVYKKYRKSGRKRVNQLHENDKFLNDKNNHKKLGLIAEKLDVKLKTEKIFTNPELSIQDVAAEIGTNRSYISSTINTFYNQNFCSYINQYRFQELADILVKEKGFSHKELATKCGFGSIDSMKRTVKINTGLSLKEWKDYLKAEENSNFSQN
ncbi:hypothetical protein SDC9_128937 [bioreactor metagenome]|uniref:HTH araC/xylS-type domain-containing protein n=1 Tax=bioreactor metagenome TaxID=1076179 RepID=A0A645CXH1_9ZZZZ|nr:helix-turn-helix domain-containing protein [Paludibacter sp.]